jgi:hypothetical protein
MSNVKYFLLKRGIAICKGLNYKPCNNIGSLWCLHKDGFFTAENKDRDERGVAMWKTMLDKQDVKIGLEREKVEAAKIEA